MNDERRIAVLRRVMAVFGGLLVASTWPLWTPRTDYPDIPWFGWAVHWPPEEWDWLWLAALGGVIASQFIPARLVGRRVRVLRCVLFAGATMLLVTDQHRLQPWAWQMWLVTVLIAGAASDRQALSSLRWVTISIYFWSAVSKIDHAFIEGHGQLLLSGLADALGLSTAVWSDTMRQILAATFPLGELIVVVLLTFRRTRRVGVWAAAGMHVLLILTLGPAGLNHEWGVLIWNVFFIVQNGILFAKRPAPEAEVSQGAAACSKSEISLRSSLTIAACLLPALSLIGWWDWWPSWAVYSSRPAIVQMLVQQGDVDALPESLQPHVRSPEPLSDWCPANLDAWSFATCWCPMYPQKRYRLAAISAVSESGGVPVQVRIQATPDRWSGRRNERLLSSDEIEPTLDSFRVNTASRQRP